MHFYNLGSTLLVAAMAIAGAEASPSFNGLLARDLVGSLCQPFTYGAKDVKIGEVCVSISGESLVVKYPNLPPGESYTDLHVEVQTLAGNIDPIQGHWSYTSENGKCLLDGGSASCTILIPSTWRACNLPLYIGVHASFSLNGKGETGWGKGTCLKDKPNCPQYFSFTPECKCPVVTTYKPHTTTRVYTATIYEERTVTCSTVPPPVTATVACNNPHPGTQTVTETPEVTDLVCPTPVQ